MVDRLAVNEPRVLPRNPGPSWGFRFLLNFQRLPRWFTQPLAMFGTWVAVAVMPRERAHSRAYLSQLHGRRVGLVAVWRHFFSYLEFLQLRLRVAAGEPVRCSLDPAHADDFEELIASEEPALFGTFHFGHSDLLGFALTTRGRRVAMIRLRMANAEDTQMLEQTFGRVVRFIWVNEPENLLFAMKSALERGESIAMQCDRLYSSKTEPFRFLGARRRFPFAIYHLALLFQRPVMFCFGLPDGKGGTRVCASPLFRPDPGLGRAENLERARAHFQATLGRLETLVRQHPTLWFNFIPLNPEVPNIEPS
jgi:predicted LPLAT superfamily acyltransferase